MDTYTKTTKSGVTNLLKCGDKYLFIKRIEDKEDLGGVMTGIGGKVENHENYLDAAIRETEEETGIKVKKDQVTFKGLERWNYKNTEKTDWIVGFFLIEVESEELPTGNQIEEGELVWLTQEEVLKNKNMLLDDMELIIDYMVKKDKENSQCFIDALVDDNHKIISHTMSVLRN